jgi:hypothetical protein
MKGETEKKSIKKTLGKKNSSQPELTRLTHDSRYEIWITP